jgi:L-arabinose transport system substrate-binding protein
MYDWIANGKEPPKLTLTSGSLALRGDYEKVRKGLGIE